MYNGLGALLPSRDSRHSFALRSDMKSGPLINTSYNTSYCNKWHLVITQMYNVMYHTENVRTFLKGAAQPGLMMGLLNIT
jgi:hypothetical protein